MEYHLTLADLGVGVQEIVLVHRHGRKDEEAVTHRQEQHDLYRYMSKALSARELKMDVKLEISAFSAWLKTNRIYHHAGDIYRLIYAQKGGFKIRLSSLKEHEIRMMQVAQWLCGKMYATKPKHAYILCHCLAGEEEDSPIIESEKLEIPSVSDQEIEKWMHDFLLEIKRADGLDEQYLPPCSEDQRHSSNGNHFVKCQDTCRARFKCHQFAAFKKEQSERLAKSLAALQ